ncbi:DNA-binding MarR family transcriptional regulator [Microlunatus panaciterrae]|uniref:DNA-binding MarR family transcriptional regulator n=1 Tax=Microlunatus panaciterrae TaxID=400768 RepID=A0ABS2RLC0_9ACTN|nr:MarR family transcriptional regulator [Microlunatus panaciterrae]MBM7799791.1 DNA-binding MarR family transcriptional regulator [Microlunatus panaciterrae]
MAAPSDHASELIMRAARTLRHRFAVSLEPWELSPHQSRALRVVAGRDDLPATEPLRVSALAEALHIAPRSATEVVDALEAKGLLERLPDESDRRATCLRLTEAGRTVAREVEEMRAAQAETFLSALRPDERATLAELLRRLLD